MMQRPGIDNCLETCLKPVISATPQTLCTFISAASKVAQLQCLWRSKNAGQVSAITWAMASYTCLGECGQTCQLAALTSAEVIFVLREVFGVPEGSRFESPGHHLWLN